MEYSTVEVRGEFWDGDRGRDRWQGREAATGGREAIVLICWIWS